MRIKDKVAVVTGAGSGIGLAIARLFVDEGAKVVAADWNASSLETAAWDIGSNIVAIKANVANEAECVAMIDRAMSEFGRVDVLVNNAGVMDLFQSVADLDNAMWQRCMTINVDGPMYAMRRAVPLMLEQGGGSIINVASAAALGGGSAGAAYTASKYALVGLTMSTAYQYARQGLRCNALAVGGVSTNIMDSVSGMAVDQAALARLQPYHASSPGMLDPEDVANLALFLASDESRHLNGAVIPIDMGWSAA
jgi:NAD(P)-dependent dehydrogenase (short-subunit alcohol dehydrogenase family)